MTQLIDITQRAAARAYDFHPGYGRRTDADRRPARPVVRPNDGPGQNREQVSREIRDRLTRLKPWMQPAPEPKRRAINPANAELMEKSRVRMVRYLRAVANGCRTNATVAAEIGEDQDIIHYIGARAVKRGLLIKGDLTIVGKLRVVPLKITDAGRAWLEANQ